MHSDDLQGYNRNKKTDHEHKKQKQHSNLQHHNNTYSV